MVDLSTMIAAKSDQLNADDLRPDGPLGGPITIQITRVEKTGNKEQPLSIYFEGDRGKPYKPGLSMRRVLVNFWGKDGQQYVGRWLTLYCDASVMFGSLKVGGIRIGEMSHVSGETEMPLATTKGAKRLFKVKPLRPPEEGRGNGGGEQRQRKTPKELADAYIEAVGKLDTLGDLAEYQAHEQRAEWLVKFRNQHPDEAARIDEANRERFAALSAPADDDDDDGIGATVRDGATGELVTDPADDDDDDFPGDR